MVAPSPEYAEMTPFPSLSWHTEDVTTPQTDYYRLFIANISHAPDENDGQRCENLIGETIAWPRLVTDGF